MKDSYHAIYLSPHLDDVVLSCGGQIAARTQSGEPVLIVTLASGDPEASLSPLAQKLHAAWRLDNSCAVRREEDRRACAVLGADYLHVATPDAMYRNHTETGEPLYATRRDVFGPVHPADGVGTIWEETLQRLPPARHVVVPLGVGGHVDHGLVRRAAEGVFGKSLHYYEDYPYAGRWFAVRKATWPPWHWRARIIPLAPEHLRARYEATAAYASQLDMLFDGAGNLEGHLTKYVGRVGGERMWRRR